MTAKLDDLFKLSKPLIVLLLIIIVWNILSVYLSGKIWPMGKNVITPITYDKHNKKIVGIYKFLVFIGIFSILFSVIPLIITKKIILPSIILDVISPVLFYLGLLIWLVTMSYFSGLKNISINEVIVYPYQFIDDSLLRKKQIDRKIKFETISIFFIITISILALYYGYLNSVEGVGIISVSLFAMSRFRVFKSIN